MDDSLAKLGPSAVSGVFAIGLTLWSRYRVRVEEREKKAADKTESEAAANAADALQARRAAIDARIEAAIAKAEEAHERLDRERKEWLDGHHRVRGDLAKGLTEAYERLRLVEQSLAVIHALDERGKKDHG